MAKKFNFGKWLQSQRASAGLSQADLAEKVGVSQPIVSQWETGKASPSQSQRSAVEAILGRVDAAVVDAEVQAPISAWLSRHMNRANLTAAELANRSGLSLPTVYNLLASRAQNPHRRTIQALENALRVDKADRFEQSQDVSESANIANVGNLFDFNPHDAAELPNHVSGIYVFYDVSERPIYVGESQDIGRRISEHSEKFWFKKPIVESAMYIEVKDAVLRQQIETILIRFLKNNAVINKQKTDRG